MSKFIYLIFLSAVLSACGGGSDSSGASENQNRIEFQFQDSSNGWQVGFADYPPGQESLFELDFSYQQLPPPLQAYTGLRVSGNNRSDDLFMFVRKKIDGLQPNRQYQLEFSLTFATNAPRGCIGVGGAPGEGVTIKAGASLIEPLAVDKGTGLYQMNIDKGNQSVGGQDAIVMGDFANSKDCNSGDTRYELKSLNSAPQVLYITTDSMGSFWLMFATDSGFEATTSIYFIRGILEII